MSRYWWSPYHEFPMMRRSLVFFHTFALQLSWHPILPIFFQMRSFSNRFSNLYFHMPRMTQKLFQFYFQVCFLPFFVVGGDVLCVKEFKCLYTRHLAKAWQGMFFKKISRKNRPFFFEGRRIFFQME